MLCNAQESLVGSGEVGAGASFALEASVEGTAPAHGVCADGVAEEEVTVDAEVVAALCLVVVGWVHFSVDVLVVVLFHE